MSGGLWIGKSGFRATEWDSTERAYVDKPIRSLFHELRSVCHIEDGVTLGDIIEFVVRNSKLSELVGEYSWCDVDAFVKESRRPCIKPSELKYVELTRTIEIDADRMGTILGINDSIDVHGRDESDTHYALDFSPVNEIAHLPVRLAPNVTILDWRTAFTESKVTTVAEGETCFTFLEIITELFYEISFHGSPEQRDEFAGDLLEVKRQVDSGEAKLVPWEKVIDEDDKKVN